MLALLSHAIGDILPKLAVTLSNQTTDEFHEMSDILVN